MLHPCPKCRGFYTDQPYEGITGTNACKCDANTEGAAPPEISSTDLLARIGKAMLEIEACRGEMPAGIANELQNAHTALRAAAVSANRWMNAR